ncbi:hypothetical protein ACIGDM_02395 [Rothia koreensis]|uniref:hypothetical protein n=1 Tax=Rothia koreensis TaxID=592378 RepID=UPI0037C86D76
MTVHHCPTHDPPEGASGDVPWCPTRRNRLAQPVPLFVGLPGGVADAVLVYTRLTGILPWIVDRSPVDELDLLSASYRPLHRGRLRSTCLMWALSQQVPEVLARGGFRPEDAYLRWPHHDDDGRPGASSPVTGLVVRPDVVVETCWPDQDTSWDLPVVPDVPCLQLFRDHAGMIGARHATTWERRRCPDCLERARAEHDAARPGLTPMSIVALIGAVATGQRPGTDPWTGPAWPDCVCALGSGTPGSGALESGGPESDAVGLATPVAGDPDLSVHPWSDTVEKA